MRARRSPNLAALMSAAVLLIAAPFAAQNAGPVLNISPQSNQPGKPEASGVVVVGLIVDTNGLPQDVHVLRGVGMGLDEKAVEAVKQYRFKPAMQNGKPVAVHLQVEVNFKAVPTLQILHSVPLELTDEARQKKASGSVEVAFTVDIHGNPTNVHVLRGVGMGMDEKAIVAIKQYKFAPCLKDGQPVAQTTSMQLKFDAR